VNILVGNDAASVIFDEELIFQNFDGYFFIKIYPHIRENEIKLHILTTSKIIRTN